MQRWEQREEERGDLGEQDTSSFLSLDSLFFFSLHFSCVRVGGLARPTFSARQSHVLTWHTLVLSWREVGVFW